MQIVAMVAGLGLLVFAGVLAVLERPPEPFLIAGVALIVALALGRGLRLFKIGSPGLGVTIEQQAEVVRQAVDKEQPPDVKLLISTGVPVGGAEQFYRGSEHIVEATIVNTSDRPIGVQSIGLELDDRRWLPGIDQSPSADNKRLPAVLAPQEQASVWWDHNALRELLREEGRQLGSIIANLRDGTKRRQPVPDDWRSLK